MSELGVHVEIAIGGSEDATNLEDVAEVTDMEKSSQHWFRTTAAGRRRPLTWNSWL